MLVNALYVDANDLDKFCFGKSTNDDKIIFITTAVREMN